MPLTPNQKLAVGLTVMAVVLLGVGLGVGLGIPWAGTRGPHWKGGSGASGMAGAGAGVGPGEGPAQRHPGTDVVHAARRAGKVPARSPDFPVHAVFTWVNGEDEAWRASKRDTYQRLHGTPYKETPRDPMRAPDGRDELYYSVHAVTKFCPWLERVWIVTVRGHRPRWLGLGDGDGRAAASAVVNGVLVTVVHHDRVLDPKCTPGPTFNSFAIESHIPHIAQLAEHFIMFNDDFFVGRPMHKSDFFTAKGQPVVDLRDATMAINALPTMWGQHLRNTQALSRALGLGPGLVPDHVAAPVRKSALAAVVKATADTVCRMQPFRTNQDFVVWYLALNVVLPTKRRPRALVQKYFGAGDDFVRYMSPAGTKPPHLFCINQEFSAEARALLDTMLASP